MFMATCLTTVNSSRPGTPPSTPTPLSLRPPPAALLSEANQVLTQMAPACRRLLDAQGARQVGRPDAGREAVVGVVGKRDGLVLVVEREHDEHRAEDLLAGDRHVAA